MREPWPALAGAMLLATATLAAAGGFSLSPVGLSIPSRDSSASVVAENTSDAPIVIQVKTLSWRQVIGKDVREDSRELIVNPPIFKLAPGEQQLIRIASRSGPPVDIERAYRVVVNEVAPKDAPQAKPGFRFTLAMDIPVYVEPVAAAAAAPIRWQAERSATGVRLVAENPGNVHYRIVEAEFATSGKVMQKLTAIVILAKSSMVYDLPAVPAGTTTIHLSAEDGASQPVSLDIPLSSAP